ncbi:MAG TPA: hypothetical protein VM536_04765 [Chloroflexia bacterium]|nr:hypothetical protein [Chloroflexia bacterium]
MNNRLTMGIVAIVLGLLVLVWPAALQVIVGLSLVAVGLWLALQGTNQGQGL